MIDLANKKIIYIANLRMPTEKAEGVQTMKTCESLKKRGADIELWVPKRRNHLQEDPFSYYKINNAFPVIRIGTIDTVRFGKIGYIFQSFIFSFFALRRLNKLGIDNVYSRDENVLYLISKTKRNIFWETHRGNLSSRAKSVAKAARGVVVITEGLKNLYVKNGVESSKIIVAPDGVDLLDFDTNVSKEEARKKLGIPLDKKVAAYIGLLDEWKGYRTFLEASKQISEDVLFVVIGGEESQIARLKSEYPNVLFLGFLPYKELPANQKIADVLVVPNSAKFDISRLYTSPLKVFAHMASGTPIVASDLPSIREVLNEQNAVLVSPDDPASLARGIESILSDEKLAKQISAKAKTDVQMYTWESRAAKLEDLFAD